MRSRVVGALLFGLGVLMLVFAAGLAFVVGPRAERLPYDLDRTQSVAEAPNAKFLQITSGKVEVNQANLRSTVTVQPDTKETAKLEGALDGSAEVWLVGQEVIRTDTNALVSAYSTSLAVDRVSAAAQPWDKQWLDTGNNRQSVDYSGQIYKFPFNTQKKTYQIFDRDINATRPARFVKTEQIDGLETYQFTQEISNERQVVSADQLQLLLAALTPGTTSGQIVYSNTRSVWVEPKTGAYIKVQETQYKNLVGDNGKSAVLLDAVFTYTPDTIKRSADTAADNRQQLRLVQVYGPIAFAVVGLVLVALGLVIATRRPRPAGVDASVPAPRHGRGRHAGRDDEIAPDAAADPPTPPDADAAQHSSRTAD